MCPDPQEERDDGRLWLVPILALSLLSLHLLSDLCAHSDSYAFRSHAYQLNAKSPYIGICSSIEVYIFSTFLPVVVTAALVRSDSAVPSTSDLSWLMLLQYY